MGERKSKMSTNYYIRENSALGEKFDQLIHIGLSSYGWNFQLHVMPEKNINNLEDWKKLFDIVEKNDNLSIVDEYGRKISNTKMIDVITKRQDYTVSGSILKRSEISEYCIGHGEGTYDYIIGDFS